MVVKIEKISETKYVNYTSSANAYYAEIKYDRDGRVAIGKGV